MWLSRLSCFLLCKGWDFLDILTRGNVLKSFIGERPGRYFLSLFWSRKIQIDCYFLVLLYIFYQFMFINQFLFSFWGIYELKESDDHRLLYKVIHLVRKYAKILLRYWVNNTFGTLKKKICPVKHLIVIVKVLVLYY